MSFLKNLFSSGTKPTSKKEDGTVQKCDICEKQISGRNLKRLSDSQVLLSEAFWEFIFNTLLASSMHILGPEGDLLGNFIKLQAKKKIWLACDSCNTQMNKFNVIDNKKFIKTKNVDLFHAAFAAAYAWSKLYNSWPSSVQLRQNLPDGEHNCDFCRRRVYSNEELALLKEKSLPVYEQGGLKHRGPASIEQSGQVFWVMCSVCKMRSEFIAVKYDKMPWLPSANEFA